MGWRVIDAKWDAIREAFAGFEPSVVADFDSADVERLAWRLVAALRARADALVKGRSSRSTRTIAGHPTSASRSKSRASRAPPMIAGSIASISSATPAGARVRLTPPFRPAAPRRARARRRVAASLLALWQRAETRR